MAQVPFWLAGQTQVVNSLVTALEQLNVSTVLYFAAVPLADCTAALDCCTACPSLLSWGICRMVTLCCTLCCGCCCHAACTQSSQSPSAYSQALLALEAAMTADSLAPHSPLEPDWQRLWQQQWRDSLSGVKPPSWEGVALHLSMMGRHVLPRQLRMSREAFLTTVEGSRWVQGQSLRDRDGLKLGVEMGC